MTVGDYFVSSVSSASTSSEKRPRPRLVRRMGIQATGLLRAAVELDLFHGEAYDLSRYERLLSATGFTLLEVKEATPMPTRFLVAGLVAGT